MTDQQHARVIRNSAGLIIEDVEFEPVETQARYCEGCVFVESGASEDCMDHGCGNKSFPIGHPLRGKLIKWVRKTT